MKEDDQWRGNTGERVKILRRKKLEKQREGRREKIEEETVGEYRRFYTDRKNFTFLLVKFRALLLSGEENGFVTSSRLFHPTLSLFLPFALFFLCFTLSRNSFTFLLLLSDSFVLHVGTLPEGTFASYETPPLSAFNLHERRTRNLVLEGTVRG